MANKHGTYHGLTKRALKTLQRYRSDAFAVDNDVLAWALNVAITELIDGEDGLVVQALDQYARARSRQAEAA